MLRTNKCSTYCLLSSRREQRFTLALFVCVCMSMGWLLGSFIFPAFDSFGASVTVACHTSNPQTPLVVHQVLTQNATNVLQRVLLLTPLKNSQKHLPRFFELLSKLSYPPHLLSLGMLVSDSDDVPSDTHVSELVRLGYPSREVRKMSGTLAAVLAHLPVLKAAGWQRATVVSRDFDYKLSGEERHGLAAQPRRRAVLARSRNYLCATALREDVDWVLWLDSDLTSYASGVLQRLIATGREIVVPNVVMAPGARSYDLNSWRHPQAPGNNATVEEVIAFHNNGQSRHGAPLQLEGYTNTGSLALHDMRSNESDATVRLDGVGGAMLLVWADLHRMGLVFPPFAYRGRIETEGLAMMALDMGVLSHGVPGLEVIHE